MRSEDQTAQAEDVLRAGLAPKHAGLFEASADDSFASRFHDARADGETFLAEASVVGSARVTFEVVDLAHDGFAFGLVPLRVVVASRARDSSRSPEGLESFIWWHQCSRRKAAWVGSSS